MEGEMANQSTAGDRLIDRRTVLQGRAALAAAGPALLRGAHAQAQPRPRGASPMTIIDSQVHAYEANTPQRPWYRVPNWPAHVTGDEMVAAMDKVGIDGAIFISPFSMYQYDGSYAVEGQRAHPNRFALVKPVNPDDPAVAEVIADWKKTPGTVGIRIIFTKEANRAGRSRLRTDPARRREARFSGQRPVLGQRGCGHRAGRSLPRHTVHHRPSCHPATASPARAAATLGRPAESAGTCQAQERSDQGQRRLHALKGAISVPGHLGPSEARVRRLGVRALPLGHGLDARVRSRQLRAGGRTVPEDRPPKRQRASHADG